MTDSTGAALPPGRRRGQSERPAKARDSWFRHFFDHDGRGAVVRRGIVRSAILAVLRDAPMHGYQVIGELETRTGGRWRPSAGSVYPTLQQLEDEGLLAGEESEGRRPYQLTVMGGGAAAETPLARLRWMMQRGGSDRADLRALAFQLMGAAVQVQQHGSDDAKRQAKELLAKGRRDLYRLLADDDEVTE